MSARNLSRHRSPHNALCKLNRQVMVQRELPIPRPARFTVEKPVLRCLLGVTREVGSITLDIGVFCTLK